MDNSGNTLFAGRPLSEYLEAHTNKVRRAVDAISDSQFAASTDDQIVAHIASEWTVQPLLLHVEDLTMGDPVQGTMDVSSWPDRNPHGERGPLMTPSFSITYRIPYEGPSELWWLRPNTSSGSRPRAAIKGGIKDTGHVLFSVQLPADTPAEEFKRRLVEQKASLARYVGYQSHQIQEHNAALPAQIREAIAARRLRNKQLTHLVDVLDVPIVRKPGVPNPPPILLRPQISLPALRQETATSYQLPDQMYEHILNIIRHEGATYESTQETFQKLDEEDLRNIIVAHLNGHYEGAAKGEAFRRAGKTDILVEHANRSAFVAECKEWHGKTQLHAALDQLLGYLTWKDCKATAIMFNKTVAGFRTLQDKLPSMLREHPKFVREVPGQRFGE